MFHKILKLTFLLAMGLAVALAQYQYPGQAGQTNGAGYTRPSTYPSSLQRPSSTSGGTPENRFIGLLGGGGGGGLLGGLLGGGGGGGGLLGNLLGLGGNRYPRPVGYPVYGGYPGGYLGGYPGGFGGAYPGGFGGYPGYGGFYG